MDSQNTFLLIRSARRTLAMEIKPDATLVVRAPKRLPLREIQRFIASHDDWINRKQSQARSRPQPQAKEFVDGEKFLITGNSCELLVVGGTSKDVDFDGRLLLSAQALPHAREAVTKWYRLARYSTTAFKNTPASWAAAPPESGSPARGGAGDRAVSKIASILTGGWSWRLRKSSTTW